MIWGRIFVPVDRLVKKGSRDLMGQGQEACTTFDGHYPKGPWSIKQLTSQSVNDWEWVGKGHPNLAQWAKHAQNTFLQPNLPSALK